VAVPVKAGAAPAPHRRRRPLPRRMGIGEGRGGAQPVVDRHLADPVVTVEAEHPAADHRVSARGRGRGVGGGRPEHLVHPQRQLGAAVHAEPDQMVPADTQAHCW
jgi:hypothetical protein